MMPMQILRNQAGRVLRNGDDVILRGIAIMYITFSGTLETGSLVFAAGTYPATAHVEDAEIKYWRYRVAGGGETREIKLMPRMGASSEWEVSIILQGGVGEDIRSFWRREQGAAGSRGPKGIMN